MNIPMNIKVLGTGCAKCKTFEKAVINTLAELNIAADIEKVEDIRKIIEYGIMSTPALVINEKVVLKGSLPSSRELREIILKYNQ